MGHPLEVTCEDVREKQNRGTNFLLLDCREQSEYDQVHIEGTLLIPMSELTERVHEIENWKSGDVIVHCHHGGRSLRVANWLKQQGFAQVYSMAGGIDRWAQVIQPGMERY